MVTIRRAVLGDAAPLHALIEGAYRGDTARAGWTHEANLLGGQRTDLDTLSAILADDRQAILIATDRGTVVGCVHLCIARAGLAYLGLLTVDPARQAGGVGKQLLTAAEAAAGLLDAREIEMTVIASRTELIAYYQRRGYALTGERRPFPYGDHRFGLPQTKALEFVVMSKCLIASQIGAGRAAA